MIVDEFQLPSGGPASYLLHGLARLIQLRGAETFVAAPLVLAEARYFPDRVERRARGVAVLLRRLLAYAGLEPKRLDIEIYGSAERDPHVKLDEHGTQAAAWFMDIAEGVYRFGVCETELGDEQALIGTLGHEVAHAYRAHHGLTVVTRETEEQLTDLTTVYLGFGVFTLESSFQFKTGHYDSSGQRLLYERKARGYLRPGQLAFLLGAQLVARGAREDLLPGVLDSLSVNQGAAVRQAVKQLSTDKAALLETLGLLPVADWPAPHTLDAALRPLPEASVVIHDRPRAQRAQADAEQFGFRVAGSRLAWGAGIGLFGGSGAGLALHLEVAFWPLVLALGGVGALLGRARSAPSCSGCSRGVPEYAERCDFCELPLVGDISALVERFEAEEHHRANAEQRREQAATTAEQRCPQCHWVPVHGDLWLCTCGHRWYTFETRGRCPACAKQWETTACLSCQALSPHQDWYVEPRPGTTASAG